MVNNWQNERKATYLHRTKTNRKESVARWFQGGTHFGQWRIRQQRIIWVCSWNLLSRNTVFFCFPCSRYFLPTDCWCIKKWSTSYFAFWGLTESPAGWNSSIFILFDPSFILLFIQGLISVLECFMTTKWVGFESLTTFIECWNEMLTCWNRLSWLDKVVCARSHWGVNNLWELWHLGVF